MVQPTLNDPVAPLEREHPFRLQFIESQTAQKINHFPMPLALTFDPCLQPCGSPRSREACLSGGDFQAIQEANLQAAPVVFPYQHMGSRCWPRGKKPVLRTGFGGCRG